MQKGRKNHFTYENEIELIRMHFNGSVCIVSI